MSYRRGGIRNRKNKTKRRAERARGEERDLWCAKEEGIWRMEERHADNPGYFLGNLEGDKIEGAHARPRKNI